MAGWFFGKKHDILSLLEQDKEELEIKRMEINKQLELTNEKISYYKEKQVDINMPTVESPIAISTLNYQSDGLETAR